MNPNHAEPCPELTALEWIRAARCAEQAAADAWRQAVTELHKARNDFFQRCMTGQLSDNIKPRIGESDVLSETWHTVVESIRTFRGEQQSELDAWVNTILYHTLAEMAERERCEKRNPAREAGHASGAEIADRREPSPSTASREAENWDKIELALHSLPSTQSHVLRQHTLNGRPLEEVAQEMNMTTGAVRALISRARENLMESPHLQELLQELWSQSTDPSVNTAGS